MSNPKFNAILKSQSGAEVSRLTQAAIKRPRFKLEALAAYLLGFSLVDFATFAAFALGTALNIGAVGRLLIVQPVFFGSMYIFFKFIGSAVIWIGQRAVVREASNDSSPS